MRGMKMTAHSVDGRDPSFVSFRIIGLIEQIVDADVIEICKLDENVRRNIVFAGFVFAVTSL